jgi:hypothetical protein
MTCQSGFRRVDMAGSIAVRSRKEEVWGVDPVVFDEVSRGACL